ncbi:hypothetical protein M9434_006010 [Picochlorum sp. BPE23]|nr:hypothetical protein M9434_006010 [Picochlorum sp. BPE23]
MARDGVATGYGGQKIRVRVLESTCRGVRCGPVSEHRILNATSYFIRLPSVGGHRVEVTRMMCGRCTIIRTELDQKRVIPCKGSRLNETIG